MSDTIEKSLGLALTELAEARGTEAEARLRSIDYHPRTRPRLRWPLVGVGGTTAAAGVAAAVVLLSSGAAPAFAGWTPVPTAATPAALTAATASCNYNLNRDSPTVTSGEAVLSETRGLYTAVIYVTGSQVYDCVTSDSSHSTEAGSQNLPTVQDGTPAPGPDQIAPAIASGGGAPGFPGGGVNEPLPERWQKALTTLTNPTQRAQQEQIWRNELDQGVEYHFFGQAGSDVTAVTFNFVDGLVVDATVENGWYFAWWPTLNPPTSIQVTTNSGTSTATLGPLGGPQCQGSSGCVFSAASS